MDLPSRSASSRQGHFARALMPGSRWIIHLHTSKFIRTNGMAQLVFQERNRTARARERSRRDLLQSASVHDAQAPLLGKIFVEGNHVGPGHRVGEKALAQRGITVTGGHQGSVRDR
jgi:hypothetical protein